MVIQEIQTSYTFPRIPLSFVIPDDYPEPGRISNVSVIPEIEGYHFTREELEIKGNYQITVSFFKTSPGSIQAAGARPLNCEFFSNLKVSSDGFLADSEETHQESENDAREMYTVHFNRPFHTFIDIEFINRPRSFKPAIVVERVDLDIAGKRELRGELVLGLANRVRRGPW